MQAHCKVACHYIHNAAKLGIKPMEFIDKVIEMGIEQHAGQRVEMVIVETQVASEFFDELQ